MKGVATIHECLDHHEHILILIIWTTMSFYSVFFFFQVFAYFIETSET